MTTSPLLRELVISLRLWGPCDPTGPAGWFIAVVLDAVASALVEQLHVPMPTDPRLLRIAAALGQGNVGQGLAGKAA